MLLRFTLRSCKIHCLGAALGHLFRSPPGLRARFLPAGSESCRVTRMCRSLAMNGTNAHWAPVKSAFLASRSGPGNDDRKHSTESIRRLGCSAFSTGRPPALQASNSAPVASERKRSDRRCGQRRLLPSNGLRTAGRPDKRDRSQPQRRIEPPFCYAARFFAVIVRLSILSPLGARNIPLWCVSTIANPSRSSSSLSVSGVK